MKKIIAIAIAATGLVACGSNTNPDLQDRWNSLSGSEKNDLCLGYSMFDGDNERYVEFILENEGEIARGELEDFAVVLGNECW